MSSSEEVVVPEQAGQLEQPHRPEVLEQVEALWTDPEIVSYSFRRHGNYERDKSSGMRGALTSEGIEEVRTHANNWASKLPEQSEIEIYQSPSFMPAKKVNPEDGSERVVRPMRATITASLYEKAVFGDLKAKRLESGEVVSARRVSEPKLGDFLELAVSAEAVGDFYDVLGNTYQGLTPKFWEDFTHDTLDPSVAEALTKAGGTDSLGLAENVTEFIEGHNNKAREEKADSKRAVLAVTHGESMRSFVYYVGKYLEHTGTSDEVTTEAFRTHDFGYNDGVDIHVTPDEVTIVVANKHVAALQLKDFQQYLKELREEKSHATETVS